MATVLLNGLASTAGGGITYLRNVLPRLARLGSEHRFLAIVPAGHADDYRRAAGSGADAGRGRDRVDRGTDGAARVVVCHRLRRRGGEIEVLLVHLGGPFWAKRHLGAWTIAKGEFAPDEDPLQAAIREFEEETGCTPAGDFQRLTTIKQKAGKVVHAWAVEMDWDTALLTSNTSSIPLDELREHIDRPAQFAGLHYFNPVALMPLVEIIHHDGMAPQTQERLAAFCKKLDKLPVPVAGTPGFLVNRVLFPYMLEAVTALAEGIPGPAIDKAAVKFGMPMGPIELVDTVGLDVGAGVAKELAPFLGIEVPAALGTVEAGKRGKKDGQGLYTWVETEKGSKPQKPELPKDYKVPEDLEDRLILPMLNEAVACLHDGVVADAELLDAGVIFGTGFAPFRGGPIQHIRAAGADALVEKLKTLQARHGDRFAPRPGWDNPLLRQL